MRREVFQNQTSSTLADDASGVDTTITLADGSGFPATGDFHIKVDDEILLVTSRSSDVLTVTRGQESTGASSHTTGAAVTLILTAASVQAYLRDNVPGANGSKPPFRLLDATGAPLTSSDFTLVNGTNATVSDSDGQIILRKASVSGQDFALLARSQPTPPADLVIAMRCLWPSVISGARIMAAIGARESSTGKLLLCSLERMTTHEIGFSVFGYSSPTSEGATRLNPQASIVLGPEVWLKVSDDNTNITFGVSDDGVTWITLYTQTRVTDFTTAPDQWVWGASSNSSSFDTISRLVAWQE